MRNRNFFALAIGAVATILLFQNCAGDGGASNPASNSDSNNNNTSQSVNKPPTVSAGADITAVAPAYNVPLKATASDEDGTVASLQWMQMSGPSESILSGSENNVMASSLLEGTYVFRVVATDDKGDSAYDEVNIIVNKADNILPIVDAGSPQTIQMPANKVTLSGHATDTDGTIKGYQWKQVSGPNTATLETPADITTIASGLAVGAYEFQLQAMDNSDGVSVAAVTVTVLPSSSINMLPVAKAGADQVIQLPTSSVNVTGTASDSDGSIVSTIWSQVSGPNTAKIDTPAKLSAKISGLVKGVYVFQLYVIDNQGGKSVDEVQVIVNVAGNKPPVVNAGPDQTIQLPVSEAALMGTATDSDGSIAKIQWIQESGPATATMATATKLANKLSKLVAGTYQFQLKVTDNKGSVSIDSVKITVKPVVSTTNKPPSVNAGPHQFVQLPKSETSLAGVATDADGTIASVEWTQTRGPNTAKFDKTNVLAPKVSGLVLGTYEFRLKAYDNKQASSTASVTVEVKPPQDITLPTVKITVAPNAVLSGQVTITANAADNVGVDFVSFSIDGKAISGGIDKTAPYSVKIDTASMTNGMHKLKASVVDTSGNQNVSAEVVVEFLNPREGRWSGPDSAAKYISISSDKLSVTKDDGDKEASAAAYTNFSLSSGKWYYEATVTKIIAGTRQRVGIAATTGRVPLDGDTGQASYGYEFAGTIAKHESGGFASETGGVALKVGNTLGIAVDQDNNAISFYVNGKLQKKIKIQNNFSYSPMFMGSKNSNGTIQANFGSKAFKYTPPSGFKGAWKY